MTGAAPAGPDEADGRPPRGRNPAGPMLFVFAVAILLLFGLLLVGISPLALFGF